TDASYGAGDFFEWGNTWVSYTAPNYPSGVPYLKNYSPDYLQEDRDYHPETPKPGYEPFPYPHPDRW
ncbi:MAG: hypothetical protein KAI66_11020, partial [Lentisphaeria bacterium]|nr:hypothetical protein [Lentisphaeria bacterium]